jgi:lipoate-protein ligase A
VSLSEINKAFKTGFERAFNIKLDSGQLIGFEIDLAKKLKKEKYASKDWNFGR